MSDETDTPSARPRTSRFREHTNTTNSIRPPPDELWKDLAIDQLIDDYNEENSAPPATARKVSSHSTSSTGRPGFLRGSSNTSSAGASSSAAVAASKSAGSGAPTGEGTFGRFQRAFASVFGVLGKRKAGNADAEQRDKEQQILDERKRAAEAAYHEAKDLGLLPTPKVFVRPGMAARSHNCAAETPSRAVTPHTPSTALRHTPSKKDLRQQKKLSKRVSNLEQKLASARKELQSVLYSTDAFPPVPPLPTVLPPTPPVTSQDDSVDISVETTIQIETNETSVVDPVPQSSPVRTSSESQSRSMPRRITKKRKATSPTDNDPDYKPVPTDSEGDIDMLSMSDNALSERELEKRTVKRVKSSASRKNLKKEKDTNAGTAGGKLQKRVSRKSLGGSRKREGSRERQDREEREVRVIPDGVVVPFVPGLPEEVVVGSKQKKKSTKTTVTELKEGDDGYGGLEHEMF